jgi:hypothetical protein
MSNSTPDPALVSAVRNLIAIPKQWVAGHEIAWLDAGGKPKGYKFRAFLETGSGYQPAGVFVDGYYKPTRMPNVRDKLSLSLMFNGARVLGVDDGGPTMHRNDIGIGRPHFMQRVGHPQLHTVSDDGLVGYAEPLNVMPSEALWTVFLNSANIIGAPPLTLPTVQLDLIR